MHGFSHYCRIKYIPRRRSVSLAHRSRRRSISPTYHSSQHRNAIHEVGVLAVKDQKVILQAVHEVEALNVIILKVLGKIMIKTLKTQRVPVSSPVEHESLNLLHRNDSSHSRSREYSSSFQYNNLYESHEIGSPSRYNELPSRSCNHNNCNNIPTSDSNNYNRSKTLTDKSVIDDNQPNIPTSNNNQSKSHIGIRSNKQSKISDINPSDNREGKLTNISLNLYTICILGLTSANNIDRQSNASTREESI
ncbi:30233_t:CDS:2 [Gigaspora margarita]|uniref:30233_t:CDS:1 n=1 Tax=Gigaspora margarita TaxID=4874 RepID=A0ABN7VKK5_GIGMA|nr:30233_t:CDS:2 [Gigaspora margarita]